MPVLLIAYGPFATLGVAGVATIVLTGVGLVMIGSAADRPVTPYEATISRVIKLPLFAGVSASRLEAAMEQVVEMPVTAGEAVVRQGEPADRFYIIESGAFTVTQAAGTGAEPVVLRKLGADEVFGEIGLLNRTSRGRRRSRPRRTDCSWRSRATRSSISSAPRDSSARACSGCTRAGPPGVDEDSTQPPWRPRCAPRDLPMSAPRRSWRGLFRLVFSDGRSGSDLPVKRIDRLVDRGVQMTLVDGLEQPVPHDRVSDG